MLIEDAIKDIFSKLRLEIESAQGEVLEQIKILRDEDSEEASDLNRIIDESEDRILEIEQEMEDLIFERDEAKDICDALRERVNELETIVRLKK